MKPLPSELLKKLQKRPKHIRNVCILAHVDHGKTTLADTLVASNGIISQKMAGKLRYMDSLEEEQTRGITMKSSAISLHFSYFEEHYLMNLIDSPGHIDFSSEVSTAVRLCDGAIVVVDVVEGVSPQTQAVLRQSWLEQIKPVLVLNKIDRLIMEMKLTSSECFTHLQQILEQVNAVMAQLISGEIFRKVAETEEVNSPLKTPTPGNSVSFNWDSGQHDDANDDSHYYFAPEVGNVVFASAIDKWGFSIQDFARFYSQKLGLNMDVLLKTLWGDFYLNPKSKKVIKGAQAAGKKPLFAQLVLDNIWAVYASVCEKRDSEQIDKVIKALDIKVTGRELKHSDSKLVLSTIMSQWLSLPKAVLSMVVNHIPSPLEISEERVLSLMCSHSQRFDTLHERTKALKAAFQKCGTSEEDPVIVFVSKMCPIDKDMFSSNQTQSVLSKADLEQRKEIARLRHQQRMAERDKQPITEEQAIEEPSEPSSVDIQPKYKFLAFARVFSGVIKKGQQLFVLGPKHQPAEAIEQGYMESDRDSDLTVDKLTGQFHITEFQVEELFTFMGRDLEVMEEMQAGNVLGIGGLEEHILNSATISNDIACPSFAAMQFEAQPIVRVAIEPRHASDMTQLVRGMRLLNQADPCVQVLIQETGEHVLIAAGEVHLQRCCDDLRKRYAGVSIEVSAPIVPFRETIVETPKVDMVNEAIEGENVIVKPLLCKQATKIIELSKGKSTIRIEAMPLPSSVTRLLDTHGKLLQALDQHVSQMLSGKPADSLSEQSLHQLHTLKLRITSAFKESDNSKWTDLADHIWAFGPRRNGSNILINGISDYDRPSVWDMLDDSSTVPRLREFDSSLVNGFQLTTLTGPLCAEPMMGVAFVVRAWDMETSLPVVQELRDEADNEESDAESVSSSLVEGSKRSSQTSGPVSGQLISCVKEACKRAFESQPQRLMAAMYSCNIQATASVLGKMYGVIGKRCGRVLSESMQEGTQVFSITAVLPVAESFGFSDEIRKKTSGLASPQLQFSHWEVIDVDPFWEPSTEEEMAHFGEKYDSQNRAKNYMNQVRKRKGLKVDENIVVFAEKQRTLTKNK